MSIRSSAMFVVPGPSFGGRVTRALWKTDPVGPKAPTLDPSAEAVMALASCQDHLISANFIAVASSGFHA